MSKIKSFLKEAKTEFSHINWPSRAEAIKMMLIVISISLVMAVYLGALDYAFLQGLKAIINL